MFSLKGPKGKAFKYKFTLSPISLRLDDLFPVTIPPPTLPASARASFGQIRTALPSTIQASAKTSRIEDLVAALGGQ